MEMTTASSSKQNSHREKLDTALICLTNIAQIHGIPADQEQLKRAYVVSADMMDNIALLRALKDLGLKAREIQTDEESFKKLPLPAIVMLTNGNYIIAAKSDGNRIALIDPYRPQAFTVPIENFFTLWSGQVILVTKRFNLTIQAKIKKFGISWFIPVIWRYKQLLGQVLLTSLLIQLFGLAAPLFSQVIIDKVLVHRSLNTLDILILGMVVVGLFQIWMSGLRSYLFTNTTNKIDITLSTKLFRHITALPIKYFETWQAGEIVSRVREMETIRAFITGSSLTVVLDIVFAIVYVIMMVLYSSYLSFFALLAVPCFIILNAVVTPIFRVRLNELFQVGSQTQSFLIESITGIQTVKSLALEQQFMQKWEQLLAKRVTTAFATANLANIANNIGSLIQQGFNLAILWLGARSVMDGQISIGQLVAFQMFAGQVTGPILRLVNMWQYFQKTMVSVDRLGDILNETKEPAFNPNRTTLPAIRGEVLLDRVTFRYRPDTSEVLYQVNLDIKAGSRIGIVGRSGSGKSTLTKLVQRLYVPESGRVMIDGVDLSQVEPAWLRRQIGVVLQDNFLFSGTIRENIAIADPGASLEQVKRVAEIAGAEEFISKLPHQYDTPVGERGATLSGGQRQRIAIARALLTDPSVLIFDEATSALDYESERIIMDNLDRIGEGRTMILIAHRLSTVRKCDMIVALDKGRVIEQGTHDELLAKKGYYYYLHKLQEK